MFLFPFVFVLPRLRTPGLFTCLSFPPALPGLHCFLCRMGSSWVKGLVSKIQVLSPSAVLRAVKPYLGNLPKFEVKSHFLKFLSILRLHEFISNIVPGSQILNVERNIKKWIMFYVGRYLRMLRYSRIVKIAKHDLKIKLFLRTICLKASNFYILFQFYQVGNLIATETLVILSPAPILAKF